MTVWRTTGKGAAAPFSLDITGARSGEGGRTLRRLVIPANVDESRIEANLKDGVLEVHMPKMAAPEKPEARKIEITSA